MQIPLN